MANREYEHCRCARCLGTAQSMDPDCGAWGAYVDAKNKYMKAKEDAL